MNSVERPGLRTQIDDHEIFFQIKCKTDKAKTGNHQLGSLWVAESEDTERPKVSFEVGETVKINDGPFLNFSGVIEEIDPDKGKLKVTVNVFGRNTPVELEYWKVEKA